MTAEKQPATLAAREVTLRYADRIVVPSLDLEIPTGAFTVIVGPNACGKSTVLRALARILTPSAGAVLLDDEPVGDLPAKALARRLGMLPQTPTAPEAITVRDLVGRGRFPHQRFLRQWSTTDEEAVDAAMTATNVTALADRPVDELSGGQRQRVWLAMVLAQQVPILLLDEPTTYLDITHQLDVLDLCARLRDDGKTMVAVLHDLNLACRYADHVVCLKDGELIAQGIPAQTITPDLVREVFDLEAMVVPDPATGTPLIVPLPRDRAT